MLFRSRILTDIAAEELERLAEDLAQGLAAGARNAAARPAAARPAQVQ